MTAITDYNSLVLNVRQFLERTDLDDKIPTFIQLAEVDLLRSLESFFTEQFVEFDKEAENPLTNTITVPVGYHRALTFQVDQQPLQRISRTDAQWRLYATQTGRPLYFSRQLDQFQLVPFPDKCYKYQLVYFQFPTPVSATNPTPILLVNEPGAYLYGALVKAEPYIKGEQMEQLAIWKGQYDEIVNAIETEFWEEERSGSAVEIKNAFASAPRINRTGWA